MADVKIPEYDITLVTNIVATDLVRIVLANNASRNILFSDFMKTYVTEDALNTILVDYVTETELTTALSNYVLGSELSTILLDYVTNSSLSTTLSNYVTSTDLTTALGDYLKTVDYTPIDNTLAALSNETFAGDVILLNDSGVPVKVNYALFKSWMPSSSTGLETYVGRAIFPYQQNVSSGNTTQAMPFLTGDGNVVNTGEISITNGTLVFNNTGRYKLVINILAEIDSATDYSILQDNYTATSIYYELNGNVAYPGLYGTRLIYPRITPFYPFDTTNLQTDFTNSNDIVTCSVNSGDVMQFAQRGRKNRSESATLSANLVFHRLSVDVYYLGA